jgi:hypothetical protein
MRKLLRNLLGILFALPTFAIVDKIATPFVLLALLFILKWFGVKGTEALGNAEATEEIVTFMLSLCVSYKVYRLVVPIEKQKDPLLDGKKCEA